MKNSHIHKYIRKDIGRKIVNSHRIPQIVYACNDCTHYLLPEFIIGKESLCWNCNSPHKIKTRSGRVKKKNVCDDCFDKKNRSEDERVMRILKESKII